MYKKLLSLCFIVVNIIFHLLQDLCCFVASQYIFFDHVVVVAARLFSVDEARCNKNVTPQNPGWVGEL